MAEKSETPILDELEKGPWPSHVTELKKTGYKGLLALYEQIYQDKMTHWAHGGMVGVPGYDAGVIGRVSDRPDILKDAHTFRIIEPAAWFYKTEYLRKICDTWEKYGSGLMNLHGATGDLQLIGIKTENMVPCFNEFAQIGFDLGGSAGDIRTMSCCVGPARCEFSCIDTLAIYQELTMSYLDEMHRPRFPYKFKIKISGCPNDGVAATARSDLAIIGTWRDSIRIDQEEVRKYASAGLNINDVCAKCPTEALEWNGTELKLNADDCVRCMHCINKMPKALRPGIDKGATILIGGRARGRYGAFLAWVLVPFMKVNPPYTELKDLIKKIVEWWDENGRTKERVGETIYRFGMGRFLRAVGLPAVPQQIIRPRANPFWFYWPGEVK
ncbi:MAG: dissimilatory-type sulfite reductase subunit alpha [Euryarchaeota archaeon]|nr:dissimilatory-type sulfite reductase subunit alpha [Euryarchaeota archaeon]